MTPRPSVASSSMTDCTSALAPTSMPRVGSSSSRTLRVQAQPTRQHDLLLVAAGQLADLLLRAGRLDAQPLDEVVDDLVLLGRGRPGRGREMRGSAASTMFSRTDRLGMMPSLLRSSGQHHRAGPDRRRRRVAPHRLAVDLDCAAARCAARRRSPWPSRCARRRAGRPGRRPRRGRTSTETSSMRLRLLQVAGPQHRRATYRLARRVRAERGGAARAAPRAMSRPSISDTRRSRSSSAIDALVHDPAVAHHRHPVADAEQLVEAVADVDDRDALRLAAARSPRTASRPRAARARTSARP